MKNMKKRVGSFVLAFAVMITTVLCGVTPVQAKSSVVSADSVYTNRWDGSCRGDKSNSVYVGCK